MHVFPDGEFYDGDWHSGVIHKYANEQTLSLSLSACMPIQTDVQTDKTDKTHMHACPDRQT